MVIDSNDSQPSKTLFSIKDRLEDSIIDDNPVLEKAWSPIAVTEFGMVIDSKNSQLSKALFPKDARFEESVTDVNPVFEKA